MSQKEKYGTLSFNDILPDTLNNDILSSYWKREKYKILYFPCFENFISSRIQTKAIKQMAAALCLGKVVVVSSVGVWRLDRGPRDLFGGVGCTIKGEEWQGW